MIGFAAMLAGCTGSGPASGADWAKDYSGIWMFDRGSAINQKTLLEPPYNDVRRDIDWETARNLTQTRYWVDAGQAEITLLDEDDRVMMAPVQQEGSSGYDYIEMKFPYQAVAESNGLKLIIAANDALPGFKFSPLTITGKNRMLVEDGGMRAEFSRPLNALEGKWLFDAKMTARQFISSGDNELHQEQKRNELDLRYGNMCMEVEVIAARGLKISMHSIYDEATDKNTFAMTVKYNARYEFFEDEAVGYIALREGHLAFQTQSPHSEFGLLFSKME
jgi:hypothetical protein